MPSPVSPLSALVAALQNAPTLKGWQGAKGAVLKVLGGSRNMSRSNSAPPRIVIFPTEGQIIAARDNGDQTNLRDVDRTLVAHLWGVDFDELHELESRFFEALDYQASPNPSSTNNPPGIYWRSDREDWDVTQDSAKQGEELYVTLTATVAIAKAQIFGIGLVSSTALVGTSTTLAGAIGSTDLAMNVASTLGFPPAGYAAVDAEQVRYTGLTATSLTGLQRGANGTTPASHNNGATVTPVSHL